VGITPGSRDFYGTSIPQGVGFDVGLTKLRSEATRPVAVRLIHESYPAVRGRPQATRATVDRPARWLYLSGKFGERSEDWAACFLGFTLEAETLNTSNLVIARPEVSSASVGLAAFDILTGDSALAIAVKERFILDSASVGEPATVRYVTWPVHAKVMIRRRPIVGIHDPRR
jgi:hypothetical protein